MEKARQIIEIQNRIFALKEMLKSTDYQAIKFAEGEITASEYAPIKENRRLWRNEINSLEQELRNFKGE